MASNSDKKFKIAFRVPRNQLDTFLNNTKHITQETEVCEIQQLIQKILDKQNEPDIVILNKEEGESIKNEHKNKDN